MVIRILIKLFVFGSLGLMQMIGTYTIVPPVHLISITHLLLPVFIFLIFSPEIAEISDLQSVIGNIPLRILTFITTTVATLPLLLVKKIAYLEYNWLDNVPLKFGFKLLRAYSPEEKMQFLDSSLNSLGIGNLISPQDKFMLTNQASSISELQSGLLALIQQQQAAALAAAEAAKGGALSNILSTLFIFLQNHYGAVAIAGTLIGGGFYLFWNYNSFTVSGIFNSMHNLTKDVNTNEARVTDMSGILKVNTTCLEKLVPAHNELVELVTAQQDIIAQLHHLIGFSSEEVAVTKAILLGIYNRSLRFCTCTCCSKGITPAQVAENVTTSTVQTYFEDIE